MSLTFPTPPLKKILKAWSYLTPTPQPAAASDTGTKASTAYDAGDKLRAPSVQTVGEAQTILDNHSDST